MLYAATWFAAIVLLGLWSVAVWTAHAAVAWTVGQAADLPATAPALEGWRLPETLAAWLPPEAARALESLAAGFGPFVDRLLQSVPAMTEVLGILSWTAWGLGAALIVLLGAGLHLLIALWRRHGRRHGDRAPQALAAG